MKKVYLLFFMFLFSIPLFAYIDPGTGSMLFSLLTGVAVTFFFFMKNIMLKIRGGLLLKDGVKKQSSRYSLAIYSEGKQYWNVFKPILEELSRREIPCAYYTSGEDDPGLSASLPPVHAEYIGKGNAAYRFLNFLEADICLMTTPGLDVFQLKRSPGVRRYAHILHMVTDASGYRLFGIDYYDAVLLSGEYQQKDIRTLEKKRGFPEKKLFVIGCTYLDVMAEHLAGLPAKKPGNTKTVLVAPSWGRNGILTRYGLKMLAPLAKSSYHIIIRPHPQSMISEKKTIEALEETLASYANVEWNFDAENLNALSRSDALISDFSGIIFDYAFLFGRPVLYPRFDFDKRPYDMADIEEEAWTFRAVREIGLPLQEESFGDIEKILDGLINAGKERGDTIGRLRGEAYMYPGEAGKRAVDALDIMGKELAKQEQAGYETGGLSGDALKTPGGADTPIVD
ncbi:MAG: CDP-glycerol glycerophosphotransferase family protein [Treponema sp.]|nr:CDP-glycerol glycerophosphotransferase family protein [Treponema sp.]